MQPENLRPDGAVVGRESGERWRRARRGLVVYFLIVGMASVAIQATLIWRGKPIVEETLLVLLLMWTPAVASILTRVILREGIRDVSFRFRWRNGWRWLLLAWLYPVGVGSIAYGAAWALGLAHFDAPERMHMLGGAPDFARFAVFLLVSLTIGTLFSALSATGEEIGWRGYMMTRLVDAKIPRPVLVGGIVWGLWHSPLILSGQYAAGPSPVLSAVLFLVGITAESYLFARVRLESGSVWPAVVAHAAWNSVIQGPFDMFFGGDASRTSNPWIGESGVFVVFVSCVLAGLLVRGTWSVRRWPAEEGDRIDGVRRL